jgi:hypothetical protein
VETRGGDGGAEGSTLSAKWREHSWQDRTGGVRNDGASGGSCSSRLKVEESGVVERQWGSNGVKRWWRSAGGEVMVEKA